MKFIRSFMVFNAVCLLLFAGLPAAHADSAKKIDKKVKAALERFHKQVAGAKEYEKIAKGMLVLPEVVKAGFIIGGEYGEGALLIKGKTVDYYNIAAASFGLQAGAQKKDIVLIFTQDEALKKFRDGAGFKIGVDGNITLIDVGEAGTVDTNTVQDPILGFAFGQKGLMGDISLAGSKITKLKDKKKKD